MKTYIASLLRHAFTALAGLGGFLLSHNLIDQGDVAQVNGAGVSIGTALVVILTAVIGRLVLTLMGKMFTGQAGDTSDASGVSLLLLLGTTLALMGPLASCSPTQMAVAQSIPIRTTLHTNYGTATYSSKSGLTLEVDATSGK